MDEDENNNENDAGKNEINTDNLEDNYQKEENFKNNEEEVNNINEQNEKKTEIEQKDEEKQNYENENMEINKNKINDGDGELLEKKTIKDLASYNSELKEKLDKLEEEKNDCQKKTEELEKELKEIKKKNEDLTKENNELKEENKELKVANKELKEANKSLELPNESKELKKSVTETSEGSTRTENKELFENILEKDKKIKELENKLEKAIKLGEGEELISIIFIYEEKKIHYSIICKNTETLNTAEKKLSEKFPELDEIEFLHYFNDKKLKKKKTFKDQGLENGSIIILKEDE